MSNAAEAALKALGVEGWDALNPLAASEAKQKQSVERYQRAKIIADGVSDAALQVMREQMTDVPSWQVHELGLLNAVGFGIMREGQNSVVRWIEQQKRIAAQGPGGTAEAPQRRR